MNRSDRPECPDLFFARDHLDSPDLRAHLRRCEVCRTLLDLTTADPPREPANDRECIVEIAPLLAMVGTGQLTAEDRLILTHHLATCRECSAAATADPASVASTRAAVPARKPSRRVVVAAAALAMAAALLLVLLHQRRTTRFEGGYAVSGGDASATARPPGHGPAAPGLLRTGAASERLQVTARLVDLKPGLPDCGTLAISVTAKYQVVEVQSGAYSEPVLYVNHLCPEMARQMALGADGGSLQAFHLGDLHRLELRRADVPGSAGELTSGKASFDEYGDLHIARYWADRTDLAEPVSPAPADRRCLPVVAAECGCVYSCGAGVRDDRGKYQVSHSFWKETVLQATIDRWCVGGECTEAFFAEIVCTGICQPRPADPTCHFAGDRCVSGGSPSTDDRAPAPGEAIEIQKLR